MVQLNILAVTEYLFFYMQSISIATYFLIFHVLPFLVLPPSAILLQGPHNPIPPPIPHPTPKTIKFIRCQIDLVKNNGEGVPGM